MMNRCFLILKQRKWIKNVPGVKSKKKVGTNTVTKFWCRETCLHPIQAYRLECCLWKLSKHYKISDVHENNKKSRGSKNKRLFTKNVKKEDNLKNLYKNKFNVIH